MHNLCLSYQLRSTCTGKSGFSSSETELSTGVSPEACGGEALAPLMTTDEFFIRSFSCMRSDGAKAYHEELQVSNRIGVRVHSLFLDLSLYTLLDPPCYILS